jgi:hypothetical protein
MKAIALVLALGVSVAASAQEELRYEEHPKDLAVMLKGGIGGFTGNSSTSAGPTWGVRVAAQPLELLGIEVGYDGSRNSVGNGHLTRNGLDTLLKATIPLGSPFRPFVGAGMGVSHVSADALGFESDTMEEVPLAAGIEWLSSSVTAGFRATYRFLVDDQLSPAFGSPGGLFDASFTLGGRF